METSSTSYARLADILLAQGGYLMHVAEVYVDESATHAGSPAMAVAGYIFEKKKAVRFDRAWRAHLKKVGLPYFRMADCVHLSGPFKGWSKEAAGEVERQLIACIRANAARGFSIALNQEEYQRAVDLGFLGSPYSFCLRLVLSAVGNWIKSTNPNGNVAYFFEAGDEHQRQANNILQEIFSVPLLRDRARYASHAFVPKDGASPLQAADLLAWLSSNFIKNKLSEHPRPIRKDLQALIMPGDVILHWTEAQLRNTNNEIATALRPLL